MSLLLSDAIKQEQSKTPKSGPELTRFIGSLARVVSMTNINMIDSYNGPFISYNSVKLDIPTETICIITDIKFYKDSWSWMAEILYNNQPCWLKAHNLCLDNINAW